MCFQNRTEILNAIQEKQAVIQSLLPSAMDSAVKGSSMASNCDGEVAMVAKAPQIACEQQQLIELQETLHRFDTKTYRNCESCGQPISAVRLDAVPEAKFCIDCKKKEEREH